MRVILSTTDFVQVLDALHTGFFLGNHRNGEPWAHTNSALRRDLQDDPERERVQRELDTMVAELRAALENGGGPQQKARPQPLEREVKTARAVYRLWGGPLSTAVEPTDVAAILIAVEKVPLDPLEEETLQRRFRLTPRESQLARLLVEGRTNTDIASHLGIRPNTAHHYTERILLKLGAHNRAEAVSKILQA
jgi:DNA-binding NarL/FixJ family response regulator